MLGREPPTTADLAKRVIGAIVVLGLAAYVLTRERFRWSFVGRIRRDHALQVFSALLI
jgi:hypothetical protein